MLTNFSVYIYIIFCKEMDHQVLMLEFDANNPPHAPPQGGGLCKVRHAGDSNRFAGEVVECKIHCTVAK